MSEKAGSIVEHIVRKASADAHGVIATAEKVAQRELDQAKRRAATRAQYASAELKAQVESERALSRARAVAESSRIKLKHRQDLMEGLQAEALRRLAAAPRDEGYLGVLTSLATEAARSIGGTEAALVPASRDVDFLNWEGRFSRLADAVRTATGVSLQMAGESADVSGGITLRTTDGRISYYNTFEEIAYRRRSDLRAIITQELFG
jgi:vacuolar-type H+-ATPase subunit E/Vma4